nr:hypothetical protein [Serratia marcescens]
MTAQTDAEGHQTGYRWDNGGRPYPDPTRTAAKSA